jgi:hypothetical protein
MYDRIDEVWSSVDNLIFLKFNEVNGEQWPKDVIDAFKRDFPTEYKKCDECPWNDYVFLKI